MEDRLEGAAGERAGVAVRLVARVDLKADRKGRWLAVVAAYGEAHAEPGAVAHALAAELRAWAAWLGLDSVTIGRRGDLSRALSSAVRA